MFFTQHLTAFRIYIFFLIITSSTVINKVVEFPVINLLAYCFMHILMIYIAIYYFNKILYFIYFIIGLIFDIFLLNEIGPHLITFILLILLCNQIKYFFITSSSKKIFILIFLILILSLLFEILISLALYNYSFQPITLFINVLISLLISYPTFYLFSKIDRLA